MASPEGKKKIAALIVAGMPSPDKLKEKSGGAMNNDDDMKEDLTDGGADDEKEGKAAAEESAFGDLRAAMEKKDDKAGASAFKEFLDLCGYSKSGE